MKRILCALLAFLMLFGGARSASATPPTVSEVPGMQQAGVLPTDIQCPIEVEHMRLTFDLQSFANPSINPAEEMAVYTGKVTTEYTFYNPTDTVITTKLLFYTGYQVYVSGDLEADAHRYEILLDGEAVEKTVCTPEQNPADNQAYFYDDALWYEYEITVQPGQRVVNTLVAPIYPTVHIRYEPYIYEYTYHPIPGCAWSKFGTLDVEINTPYHMLSSAGFDTVEKTETGYAASGCQNPEAFFSFVLSTAENPAAVEADGFNWALLLALVFPFLVVAEGIKGLVNIIADAFLTLFSMFQ